ncbi:15-methylpalmitoyl-4-hydroxy-2-pyrone 4-O-methyltransferase [Virgibacillus subterraneus]|uniref:15-methylpalmitoyl-4-hydroxy-2-pyrone 4-O-methyltransferase n=1 Tax=Virgibacillus subterraneus TaxID=621109 RepID=A0A1H9ENS2_9BACI|nr:isoprenylcysteine carboxylmethyltransferase family protein [Virgibacillus subterraneus]SEQ27406.1 15-methylpalmitoyl-4-hydroxy-2-pyrone 4-O-methyltransferase [Virgibacillus subterraneus]
MTTWMWLLIIVVIAQRLIELNIAKRNERWMKDRGGIEKGEKHYKWFIWLHSIFFLSMIFEALLNNNNSTGINYFLITIFLLTQLGRIWCIHTLGKFWNTKIIVLPGVSLIKKGPYKYVKHPNYIIVAIELFIIPFLLGAYLTAFVFPLLHIILLKVRIPREEKALTKATL